ncbi:MAG: PilZ domain-containing protein [Deltaproteobacteria bacterium]|nr:PilZ domain-containing protein [Deltaproteobacteria bacterium]
MAAILIPPSERRSMRRAFRSNCQAVALDGFRLVGDRILDLSPRGLLLACDDEIVTGEELVVSFKAPRGGEFIDVEAVVARVVGGWRPYDPGYAAGLRFTRIDAPDRGELLSRLAGLPPPVPHRRLRADYAETVRRIGVGLA